MFNKTFDLPNSLSPIVQMNKPNEQIEIWKGDYLLRIDEHIITINGTIVFSWFPTPGAVFSGVTASENYHLIIKSVINYKSCSLILNGGNVGECNIYNLNFGSCSSTYVRGKTTKCLIGNESLSIDKIVFSVVNFRNFIPKNASLSEDGSIRRCRISLDDMWCHIVLEQLPDHQNRCKSLQQQGGYLITLTGEIKMKVVFDSYSEWENYRLCLATFLSFLNGKKTTPYFIVGINEGEIIFRDFTAYDIESETYEVGSWLPEILDSNDINKIWRKFLDLWTNGQKDFLKSVIHWYLESNRSGHNLKVGIVSAQIGLEFFYGWYSNYCKKSVVSDGMKMSSKLEELFDYYQINKKIPNGLCDLRSWGKNSGQKSDLAIAFPKIRNTIVHSGQKSQILSNEAIYDAFNFGVWLTEVLLLSVLEYEGFYNNRCESGSSNHEREQVFSWK